MTDGAAACAALDAACLVCRYNGTVLEQTTPTCAFGRNTTATCGVPDGVSCKVRLMHPLTADFESRCRARGTSSAALHASSATRHPPTSSRAPIRPVATYGCCAAPPKADIGLPQTKAFEPTDVARCSVSDAVLCFGLPDTWP